MEFKYLQFELSDGVGLLTINRPKVLNALNSQVLDEIIMFAQKVAELKKMRALIIRGAEKKAFVAGADIKEMMDFNREQAEEFSRKGQKAFQLIENLPCFVIVVIFGFALGGGLELALAGDMIIMDSTGRVGLPEVTLGLLPAFGGTQRLIRAVGLYKAKEMICTGNIYEYQEAVDIQLVKGVPPNVPVMDYAFRVAGDIKKRSPEAVAQSKALIHERDNHQLAERLKKERQEFGKLFDSTNAKEGMQAFIEKRKPIFT